MKQALTTFSLMVLCSCMLAGQTPQKAPLNPEYVRYLELKEQGLWKKTTEEGHALGYIPSPIKFATSDTGLKEIKDLPSSFDLRNVSGQSYLTQVRHQGNCGSCWTFSTLAAIESWLLMQDEGHYNLSENHMKQNHGFAWGPCDGGNHYFSTAYLSRGSGSILEADAPYYDYDHSTYNGNPPVMYHTDAVFLPNNENIIKQAIMEQGALYTAMHWADDSYNSMDFTYYYHGSDNPNHGVNLVGWDDNKQTAGGSGAWIVRNSWGMNWGESGYFYIAYQDTRVNNEVGYWPNKIAYSSNRVIDYSDHLGSTSGFGFGTNTGYALIKFTPDKDHELLTLGTYIMSSGATVGFEVYDNFNNGSLSSLLGSIPNQTIDNAGFITLELPTPIDVSAGNDFYVKVYYNTPGYNYPIPVEAEWNDYSYPTIDYEVSWVSSNGTSWTQMGGGTNWPYNLCVKTYGVAPEDDEAPQQNTITFIVKDQNTQPVSDAKITITPGGSKTITGMNTLNNTQSNTAVVNTSPPLNRQGYIDIAAFDYAPQNQSDDTPKSGNPEVILPGNWEQANAVGTYRWVDGDGNPLGWIFGNNAYGDTGTGMHFNVQGTHTIVGAYYWISMAASGSGNVHFRVYDFNEIPGAVLASKAVALNNVEDFPTGEGVTPDQFLETFYVEFNNPITIHGDFFVGVDFSGLAWHTHGDGIGMASTLDGQGGGGLDRAWIKCSDNNWAKVTSYDPALNFDIGVFPVIQTDAEPIILYTDANGQAVADLAEGQYSYLVEKEGYTSESSAFILTGQDKTIEVQLSGVMAPPFGLLVETEGLNPGEALFSWNPEDNGHDPETISEGFEGDFPPAGWVRLNPDGGTGWTSINVGTSPLPGWNGGTADAAPDGGSKMAYATWAGGGASANDQWLVTPQITVEKGFEMSFYLRYWPDVYDDNLDIRISTTSQDDPSAFTIIVDQLAFTSGSSTSWELYTYSLTDFVSAGTPVYIAFREHVADNWDEGATIMLDNVAVGPKGKRNTLDIIQLERMCQAVDYADAALAPDMVTRDASVLTMPADVANTGKAFLGFNVFLNEAMVAEETEETQHLFTDLEEGDYTTGVQSVYTSGSSEIVTIDFEITNGVPPVGDNIMIIHNIDAFAGEIITVELEIINEDEFAGFSLDIPLPAGFDYIEGSAQLFREDGHLFNFDILPGNVARMLSTAVPTKPFLGNDGVILSFDLQTPDEEGTYVLNILDAMIANAQGNDIMTGAEPGTVTLEEVVIDEYTLTIHIVGNGSVEVDGIQYVEPVTVDENTVLGLEAFADTGWKFEGWSGMLTGDASTANITMDEDKNITATFAETPSEEYTLTVTIMGNGSVEVDGIQYAEPVTVDENTVLGLEAIADTGWQFESWSGELEGNDPEAEILMDTDKHIIVHFAINTYTLLYNAGENGSLTGETQQVVEHGADGSPVEAIPDEGYHFAQWSDGVEENPRTDTKVTADLEVTAEFTVNTYQITSSSNDGGIVDPEGNIVVTHGEDKTFVVIPEDENGYNIHDVLIDGESQGVITSHTFESVTQNHTIEAIFELKTYVITASASEGGSIDPEGDIVVDHGESQLFTITPDEGYDILDVLIDGESVGAVEDYEFNGVTHSHTISAEFYVDETGMETLAEQATVYPNPFNNTLTITNASGLRNITLKNLFGQPVFEIETVSTDEEVINTESLPPGVYFLRMAGTDGSHRVLKIMKE